MLAHLSLATALLACLALSNPLPVEASDRDVDIRIGYPSVEIYSPPVSIHFGPTPIYRPYYYYPPYHYDYRRPPPYYYGPRYYPRHQHYYPHRRYHRDYRYRDYHHRH